MLKTPFYNKIFFLLFKKIENPNEVLNPIYLTDL